MTRWSSSTFALARPKVPSWGKESVMCVDGVGDVGGEAYPLLGELTGALVLAVAQEFDDAALVGGKAVERKCWLAISLSKGRRALRTAAILHSIHRSVQHQQSLSPLEDSEAPIHESRHNGSSAEGTQAE